jgi:hypothetical protein
MHGDNAHDTLIFIWFLLHLRPIQTTPGVLHVEIQFKAAVGKTGYPEFEVIRVRLGIVG